MSVNIYDYYLFFMWKLQPPWKKSPPSFPATPSKSWGLVKPPIFQNLVGGMGVHTMLACKKNQLDSSIHSEIRVPCPFFDHNHPKIIKAISTSLNLDQVVKNQQSSAIYSCNTGDFRVSWRKRSHTHFWPSQTGNFYISWICITIKKIINSINFFMIYS